jgi:hypothetical protein
MFKSSTSETPNQVESYLTFTNFPLAFRELGQLQKEDPVLKGVVAQLEKGESFDNYFLSKGILYCRCRSGREPKLVVPAAATSMVVIYFHESPLGGHLGLFKTINKICSQFIWDGMDKGIRSRVRACQVCALSKSAQKYRWVLLASEVAQRTMQKIFINYVGKRPRNKAGNTALFCLDAFSKFICLIPDREATTKATIKALKEKIFCSFSVPEVLVSDNAQCFNSQEFRHFCFGLGIKYVTTSSYYSPTFPCRTFQ